MSKNLINRDLKVAINQEWPYFTIELINDTLKPMTGIDVEILKTLSEKLNFTYTLIDCKGMWGSLLPNKSWTGIIGALDTKQADIGLADVAMTQERSKVVKFAFPHLISPLTFITTTPKYYTWSISNLYEPALWKYLFITMVIMALFVYCFISFWQCYKLSDIVWLIFCPTIQQSASFSRIPRILSFEILYSFWLIFSLIFYIIFGDCLYSQIVLPRRFQTIDTIDELSQEKLQGHIILSAYQDHSIYTLMKESNDEKFRSLSDSMEFMENDKEGIEAVVSSESPRAYIVTFDTLLYFNRNYERGDFYFPSDSYETTFYLDMCSIAFRKDFEYIQHFDKMLLGMREAGLFEIWKKKSGANDNFKELKPDALPTKLNLDNLRLYFYIMMLEESITFMFILLEYLFTYLLIKYIFLSLK